MAYIRHIIQPMYNSVVMDNYQWVMHPISNVISLETFNTDNRFQENPMHLVIYWSITNSDQTSAIFSRHNFTLGYDLFYGAYTYNGDGWGDDCIGRNYLGNADSELLFEGTSISFDQTNKTFQFNTSIYNNSDYALEINSYIELYVNAVDIS